jgi:hypothetical protein
MSSETEISNMAISHLGVGKEIADLDTETSAEAKACRRFYDIARDTVLRDFQWPFATKIASLGLVESDPNTEWDYSYRYPSDCITLRRILSGVRQDTLDSKVPYKIAQDSSGRLIFSDEENASVEYTVKVTDPAKYTPDFTLALSYRLAVYIAPRVTRGDPFKLMEKAMGMYMDIIGDAKANAYNEEQDDVKPESEFIRARD